MSSKSTISTTALEDSRSGSASGLRGKEEDCFVTNKGDANGTTENMTRVASSRATSTQMLLVASMEMDASASSFSSEPLQLAAADPLKRNSSNSSTTSLTISTGVQKDISSFPASRRAYAEARKTEERQQSNTAPVLTHKCATNIPAPARGRVTIHEQSQAHREARKARRLGQREEETGCFVVAEASNISDFHHENHQFVEEEAEELSADNGIDDGYDNENEIVVGRTPTTTLNFEGSTSLESSSSRPSPLLEARLVEEVALVHAEPMPVLLQTAMEEEDVEAGASTVNEDAKDQQEEHKIKLVVGRRTAYAAIVAAVLLLVGVLVIIGILWRPGRATPETVDANSTSETDNALTGINMTLASFLPKFTLQAIAQDPTSPQAQAFQWVQEHPDFDEMPNWRKRQLMALTTLYFATYGEYSWDLHRKTDWMNASVHECFWSAHKDFCHEDRSYWYLEAGQGGMKGTIPPEVSLLVNLHEIWFDESHLTGPLPTQLGQLTNLELVSFASNALSGPIPSQLGLLTALSQFDLNENQLTGLIPTELGNLSNLHILGLGVNKLVGPVPTEMGRLSMCQQLILHQNFLTGSLPTELGSISEMKYLHLGANRFTGSIPDEIWNLPLVHLDMYENFLTGSLSTAVGRLSSLSVLSVNTNKLTGPVPHQLEGLTSLVELDLGENDLTGSIPSSVCSFVNLTLLEFDCELIECTCELCECYDD